jgi:argininosuccinate synthase
LISRLFRCRLDLVENRFDQELVTFEEGALAYDQRDAAGFIKLNALRLRLTGARNRTK